MGPIQRSHTRRDVVERLIAHLREAKRMGCDVVVFPELTLTTFFPRWWMTDQSEIDSFFEQEMPSNETAPLFSEARRMALGFCLGYAELAHEDGRTVKARELSGQSGYLFWRNSRTGALEAIKRKKIWGSLNPQLHVAS